MVSICPNEKKTTFLNPGSDPDLDFDLDLYSSLDLDQVGGYSLNLIWCSDLCLLLTLYSPGPWVNVWKST